MKQESGTSRFIWVFAALIAVVAIGALVYAMMNGSEQTADTTEPTSSSESQEAATPEEGEEATEGGTTIVFTNDGFVPSEYTSQDGEAVTVRNDSDMDVEFSSADHPTHQENPELNLSTLAPGESATFTPAGPGTYGFHDHINSQYTGTLTVE